jgi:tRNA-modifying protein YgfZ
MADTVHDDYDALRHGCGLVERSAGFLALSGADRQRFLNGQVTCDVKGLTPGTGAYGFFTSRQGKVLADAAVLVGEDRIWLELPPGRTEEIAAHLGKHIIADRVEVLPLDHRPITLVGSRTTEVLSSLVPDPPERPWSHLRADALGEAVLLVRQGNLGVSAWTLWTPAALSAGLTRRLRELPGVRPVGLAALETVRAEAGIPLYGRDFGAENFPQETGLEERAVSYTKGCYLGQEVVARIHYRGGVHKGLAGLAFPPGGGVPPTGAPLLVDGKEVGTLTTAVDSPALGRPIGLAIVLLPAAAPGTRLTVGGEGGGQQGEVQPLPFVPAV